MLGIMNLYIVVKNSIVQSVNIRQLGKIILLLIIKLCIWDRIPMSRNVRNYDVSTFKMKVAQIRGIYFIK